MGGGRAGLRRPAGVYVLLLFGLAAPLFALPRRGAADELDGSIHQLRRSRVYKVRLSAALYLAKQRAPRAILALAQAVTSDPDRTVRRVAALSLPRVVDGDTDEQTQRAAIDALERASQGDREQRVRASAAKSLARLRAALPGTSPASRIFVHVGQPSDRSRALPSGSAAALLAALRDSLREHAPDYELTSGVAPTRAELASRQLRGYTVIAQVAQVAVERNGSYDDVRCTVNLRVGPWSGRDGNERLLADESASVSGSGRITSSPRGVRRAAVDCAVAVTEELSARHVIPFLRQVAARSP